MAKTDNYEELQYEWRQLEEKFRLFHDFRDLDSPWNKILRRELKVDVQPELLPLGEGIEFRSPDLEDATNKHKSTMQMEPTRIEARVPGLTQTARDTERELTLFWRRGWDISNPRRTVDARWSEGQIRHGITVDRKCYKPFEPSDDGKPLKYPFSWEPCLIDSVFWPGGIFRPEDPCWIRYSISVVESGITKDNKKVTLRDGKIGWLGPDEKYDYQTDRRNKINVIIRDYPSLDGEMCPLDGCDHAQRYITTYVCPEGANMDDAEEVETCASPFQTCSFYGIGGLVMHTERDPHKVYRPLLLPLYELIQWKNYLVTITAILARGEAKDNFYGDASGTQPETIAALNPSTERGATGTYEKPDAGSEELPVYPFQVKQFPNVTSQHLMELIKQCDAMIAEYKPNRYLTGNADVEASNATANAVMSQTQAAGMIYEPLLAEIDGVIERSIRDESHAFRYWDYMCPDDIHPSWAISVIDTTPQGKGKVGEQVVITAKKCTSDVEWLIITGNKTLAEKQAEWSMAKDQYASGVLVIEDLIRAAGIYDVELQKELLFGQRIEQQIQPLEDQMVKMLLLREASVKSGYDFSQLQAPQPQQGGQPPQSSAPHNPSPMPAAVAHSISPQVQPIATEGIQGGGSGVQ